MYEIRLTDIKGTGYCTGGEVYDRGDCYEVISPNKLPVYLNKDMCVQTNNTIKYADNYIVVEIVPLSIIPRFCRTLHEKY